MSLTFSLTNARPSQAAVDTLVVGVFEDRTLTPAAQDLDAASGGALRRLVDSGDISGKPGAVARLFHLQGVAAPRIVVVGLGRNGQIDAGTFTRAATEAGKALRASPARHVASYLAEADVPGRDATWRVRQSALAIDAQAYRYTATLKPKPNGHALEALAIGGTNAGNALAEAAAIADGVRFAKELGNLPPNICNPAWVAEQAQRLAADAAGTVTLEILERADMQRLGMGALLAVARGSANPPKLVVLRYRGAADDVAPYALVGKGITFDTGGICIKPAPGMEEMKFDMMGAATVLGAFKAVVQLRLPINVLCVVPAVENMPDGDACRPGDVVTTMSGQSVEIVNTDAEGRLILCDALTYVQRFQPRAIVDVATLTGACVIALGRHATGLFTRHDDLSAELIGAGDATHDRAWRMPVWDDYQQQIDSVFADMSNVGGKSAGAITAACFIARFCEGQRWAHLDIAGTAWDEGRKGMATGRPVPLLTQWLIDRARFGANVGAA